MKILIFILLNLIFFSGIGQQIHWDQTRDWKIYYIQDKNAFGYSLDTLKNFRSYSLDDSLIHGFLTGSTIWPKEETFLWMGFYLVTCKFEDGLTRIFDISVYGGFFFDNKTKVYYEINFLEKDRWLRYLHDCLAKLSSGN
jgi:hypothetical protein